MESLVEALEGRQVNVFDRQWNIRVYSISEHSGFRWLQLLLEGQPDYPVLARISPHQGIDETLRAVSAWLVKPSTTYHVLNVA